MSYSDRQKIRPQTSPVRMPRKLSGGSLLTASFTDASVDANGIARPATSGTSMPNVVGGSLFPAVEGARPSTSPTRQMRTKAVMTSMAETTIDPSVDARPWTAQSMQGHDPITRSQSAMAVQLSPLMRDRDRPSSSAVVRQRDPKFLNTRKKSRPKTGVRRQRWREQRVGSADVRGKSTSFLASVESFGVGGKRKPLSRK
jgi:hypothetical protein